MAEGGGLRAVLLCCVLYVALAEHQWNRETTAWECGEEATSRDMEEPCACWLIGGKQICGFSSRQAAALEDQAENALRTAKEARNKVEEYRKTAAHPMLDRKDYKVSVNELSTEVSLIQTGWGTLYHGTNWGKNDCAEGILITSSSECQTAASHAGKVWKGSGTWNSETKGCQTRGNDVWFNHAAVGAESSTLAPVCKTESHCALMERIATHSGSAYRLEYCQARMHEVLQQVKRNLADNQIPGYYPQDLGQYVAACTQFVDNDDKYQYKSAYNSNGEGIAQRQTKWESRWMTGTSSLYLPVKNDGGTSTFSVYIACFKAVECYQGSYTQPATTANRVNMKCVTAKKVRCVESHS